MEKALRFVLASRPVGEPKVSDLRLEEFPVPSPGDGEVLLRTLYLSLDPYMRGRMSDAKSYAAPVAIGGVMEGGGVAQVVASNNPKFVNGDIVLGRTGWQTHLVSDGAGFRKIDPALAPISTALGVLGMPGMTAYAGLLEVGKPKAGETLVVAAASGAVGSVVGQIAKIKGLRVVGIAGGPDKCRYVKDELGFDDCLDHRAPDLAGAGLPRPVRTASTSISRMSAARCWKRCCRCSIRLRAFRSAAPLPATTTPRRRPGPIACRRCGG